MAESAIGLIRRLFSRICRRTINVSTVLAGQERRLKGATMQLADRLHAVRAGPTEPNAG